MSTQSSPAASTTDAVAGDTTATGWRRLVRAPESRIFAVLVLLFLVFTLAKPGSFATGPNIRNVATDAAVLLVLAVGSTFVILTAGIDLSIPGVLVFSGVVAAKTMIGLGGGTAAILVGLLVGLVAGTAWGLLNGLLVARARIPALIVTLGTLGMSLGFA